MTKRYVYVISDLHMGGRPPNPINNDPGFQLCPEASQKRLAQFIDVLINKGNTTEPDLELVLNGDVVDFLAEPDPKAHPDAPDVFQAFTSDPEHALLKFNRIVEHNQGVFDALQRFCKTGHRLTVLLGNHDLELATPIVREAFTKACTGDKPARFTFLYDGQGYRVGEQLIIDHGNRNDGWNLIFHDHLRRYRSAQSRGEKPPTFEVPPGSRLVVEVLNVLKARYRFLDLLKPENEAVLPILVALEPDVKSQLKEIVKLGIKAAILQPKPGEPPPLAAIAGQASGDGGGWDTSVSSEQMQIAGQGEETEADRLMEELEEFAWIEDEKDDSPQWDTGAPAEPVSTGANVGALLFNLMSMSMRSDEKRVKMLRKAFIRYCEHHKATFDLLAEADEYEAAAKKMADDQRRFVVYGHTHLAKNLSLNSNEGWYLNTGTWCPLIRLPEKFYLPVYKDGTKEHDPTKEKNILEEIKGFLYDLRTNQTKDWSDIFATFARVVVDEKSGTVDEVGLFEFKCDSSIVPFTAYPEVKVFLS